MTKFRKYTRSPLVKYLGYAAIVASAASNIIEAFEKHRFENS